VPFIKDREPQWDSSNHLVEEAKQREKDAEEAAKIDFDNLQPLETCPF
jgi:hypothetical protein